MTLTTENVARIAHEANRAVQIVTGDPAPSPAWDEAPEWQRESAVVGVAAALDGATPEGLHESWCATKESDGWVYGPTKDADRKTHPCLVPYGDLPPEQTLKDHLFAGVVAALAPSIRRTL